MKNFNLFLLIVFMGMTATFTACDRHNNNDSSTFAITAPATTTDSYSDHRHTPAINDDYNHQTVPANTNTSTLNTPSTPTDNTNSPATNSSSTVISTTPPTSSNAEPNSTTNPPVNTLTTNNNNPQ